MARPVNDPHAVDTPTRLLLAAEPEFAARGFEGARLADIADRAGIRRPSLLHHFATKEALYAAVVRGAFGRLGAALLESRRADGFVAQLEATARAYDAFLEREPQVARIVVHELIAAEGPGQALLVGQVAPLLDDLEAWIASHAACLRPDPQIRGAILRFAADGMLRAASGALRDPLWGARDPDASWALARLTILREEPP